MRSVFGCTSGQREGDEGNRRARTVRLRQGWMPTTMWRNTERGGRFEVAKVVKVVEVVNAESEWKQAGRGWKGHHRPLILQCPAPLEVQIRRSSGTPGS